MRNALHVEVIPTIIALNSEKIDFEYLFRKGKHYELVEIIGVFLDIADYQNPCREIERGSSPFRKARSHIAKQVFPSIKTGGRFSKALGWNTENFLTPYKFTLGTGMWKVYLTWVNL
jgi:hypothetical protein